MVKGHSEACRVAGTHAGSVIGVGRKEEPGRTGRISQWGFEHPQDDLAKNSHPPVGAVSTGRWLLLFTDSNKATYLPHPAGNLGRANLISMYKHE